MFFTEEFDLAGRSFTQVVALMFKLHWLVECKSILFPPLYQPLGVIIIVSKVMREKVWLSGSRST